MSRSAQHRRMSSTTLLDLSPAAGAVVRADLTEHLAERRRWNRLALADRHRARCRVLVSGGDDAVGVRDDPAVVQEDVAWSFVASSALISPCNRQ